MSDYVGSADYWFHAGYLLLGIAFVGVLVEVVLFETRWGQRIIAARMRAKK